MYPSVPIIDVRLGVARRDRDAEVGDADPAVLIDQDVRRLQVAMQHALRVRRRQPGTQLVGDFEHAFGCQAAGALEQGREVLALHELHREEDRLARFADIEDPAHGRMRDLPREPHLLKDAAAV